MERKEQEQKELREGGEGALDEKKESSKTTRRDESKNYASQLASHKADNTTLASVGGSKID